MSTFRRSVMAAMALAVVMGLLTGPALATTNTTIGFDDQPAGTLVSTQYQADGVAFGTSTRLGAPVSPSSGDCGSPSVTAGTGTLPARSAPNYAALATCGNASAGFYAGTFGSFAGSYPRGSMSVWVSGVSTGAQAPVSITLTGYDSSGNAVATGTATATNGTWTQLTAVQSSGSSVPAKTVYFQIATSSPDSNFPQVGVDDLSFDQAGAPLSARGTAISAAPGASFSGPVAAITDGDRTAIASDFTATINWGDGTGSDGVVAAGSSPGQFTVSGTHTWSTAGSYPVAVAITKVNRRTATGNTTATVSSNGGTSPAAALKVVTHSPKAGGLITLSGAGSTPGSGHIISYDWGFDSSVTTTSTGTNPTAQWMFRPGSHTITLTVTNSAGKQSTSKITLNVGNTDITAVIPDGGQGACQPTYVNGDVQIIADCIQTLPGGGYVIETKFLNLNGMVLAPKPGSTIAIYKISDFKNFTASGTELTGPAVNFELLNTPIGNMVLGGRDLTADPLNLVYNAFRPPTILKAEPDPVISAHTAAGGGTGGGSGVSTEGGASGPGGSGSGFKIGQKQTLLMSLGVGKECSAGNKDPQCCPPTSGTTACATLPGGFPLTGQIQVWLTNNGEALFDVQVGLNLQAVSFEATGSLEVEADPVHGINLEMLQFTIQQASLEDIFTVKDASFTYYFPSDPDPTKADTWQAKATVQFGPLSTPNLSAELDFKQGQFQKASLLFTAPSGTGVPIYPGVLINQIGATVGVNPFTFGGQLGASIATQLELSAAFLYRDATSTQLGFFGAQGKLSYSGDDIATIAADVYSDGYTDAAITVDLHFPFDSNDPVVSVKGGISFWDEPTSGRWEADGSVALKLWVINAEVAGLINDKQIAGCADISGFGVQGHYDFSNGGVGGGFFAFSNCDDQLKQYKETPVVPHSGGFVGGGSAADTPGLSAADTHGGGTVKLPGGTTGQELMITSKTGTPVVTIYAPNHQTYTTPSRPGQVATDGKTFISAIAPDTHQVMVFFRHPKSGLYNIQPVGIGTASEPGAKAAVVSAPISSVSVAGDAPPARVAVKVRASHGRRFSLRYAIANYVSGTAVQFVERGRDSTHVIATVRNAHGTIGFTPQDAIGRRRTIYAYLLAGDGMPLRTMRVGRYVAPAAQRPGRIARLRFWRGGSSVRLSWSPAANARRYLIVVRGSDGRVVSAVTKHRSLSLKEALPAYSFNATVTPQGGPNMLSGPGARASLEAASTGLVEVLRCKRGTCSGALSSSSLIVTAREIRVTLTRGGRTVASGLAADGTPTQLALNVRGALPAGRYGVTIRHGRRRLRRAITIR